MAFLDKNKNEVFLSKASTTTSHINISMPESSRFISYRRLIACTCLATVVALTSFSYQYSSSGDNINSKNKLSGRSSSIQGLTIYKNFTVREKQQNKLPEIAWLMTFPNSGTSFTTALIRDLTLTTTATNYASNLKKHPPLIPNDLFGPYIERPKMNLPYGGYILTKTHCTGCRSTTPRQQIIKTVNEFLDGCACSKHASGGLAPYDVQKVKKVTHLLRNPLDNIVSRYHLQYKNKLKLNDTKWLYKYPDTKDGFRNWCKDYDKIRTAYKRDPFRKELASSGILCHSEFFQYIQWHNHAVNATKNLNIPTYTLHYSDFAEDYDGAVSKLLDFLQLDVIGEKHPFLMRSYADDYYSLEEKMAIIAFVRKYATADMWDLLYDQYFKM